MSTQTAMQVKRPQVIIAPSRCKYADQMAALATGIHQHDLHSRLEKCTDPVGMCQTGIHQTFLPKPQAEHVDDCTSCWGAFYNNVTHQALNATKRRSHRKQ